MMQFWKKEEKDPLKKLDKKPLKKVKDMLLPDENILYVSDKIIRPGDFRLVLTNKRMIQAYSWTEFACITSWNDLRRAWIEEDAVKLNFLGTDVRTLKGLPKEEREVICKIANEKLENRPITQTPVQNLEYLKEMFDKKLITQAEYDGKKADLLSKM